MNSTPTMEQAGFTLSHDGPEKALSFLVSRSKGSDRALMPTINDVLKGCDEIVRNILRSAIEIRSGAEFQKFCVSALPKYVALKMAIAQVATLVPHQVLERLKRESICEMEADFRDNAVEVFGTSVRDQALFTVWTLRKINELVLQIMALPVDDSKKKEDAEYCTKFNLNVFVAVFALECLRMAMETSRAIYPEVQDKLTDCLRTMVDAYTWARLAVEARVPMGMAEPLETVPALDDEDRALMDASFYEASAVLNGEGA